MRSRQPLSPGDRARSALSGLAALPIEERARALCRLNVVEQVRHVCESTIVRSAWKEQRALAVHGWVYSLRDGLLQDLLENPVTSIADRPCLAE